MKKVTQTIPQEQQEMLVEALSVMESALKALNSEDQSINFKLFDIITLKAMLNKTELVINIPFDVYDKFTSINGVDYPIYAMKTIN